MISRALLEYRFYYLPSPELMSNLKLYAKFWEDLIPEDMRSTAHVEESMPYYRLYLRSKSGVLGLEFYSKIPDSLPFLYMSSQVYIGLIPLDASRYLIEQMEVHLR